MTMSLARLARSLGVQPNVTDNGALGRLRQRAARTNSTATRQWHEVANWGRSIAKANTKAGRAEALGRDAVDERVWSDGPEGAYMSLAVPGPSDWLAEHEEKGQGFKSYTRMSVRQGPHGHCDTLHLVPVGDFALGRSPFMQDLVEFSSAFFQCNVEVLPRVPLSALSARAKIGAEGQHQINCGEVQDYLRKMRVSCPWMQAVLRPCCLLSGSQKLLLPSRSFDE